VDKEELTELYPNYEDSKTEKKPPTVQHAPCRRAQGQYWIEYLYLLLATPPYYQYGRCMAAAWPLRCNN